MDRTVIESSVNKSLEAKERSERARNLLMMTKIQVTISVTCVGCDTQIQADTNSYNTEHGFVDMLIRAGWTATPTGPRCQACGE